MCSSVEFNSAQLLLTTLESRYVCAFYCIMGRLFTAALDEPEEDPFGPYSTDNSFLRTLGSIYRCANCHTHLARRSHLLSSNFRGRTGAALLLESLVNVVLGPQEDTIMTTGMHSIRVCFCIKCLENIGWTYEEAFEDDQKYKEHRFILEERLVDLWTPSEGATARSTTDIGRPAASSSSTSSSSSS